MRSRRRASEGGGQQHGGGPPPPTSSLLAFCLLSLSCGIASVRCCTISENGVELLPEIVSNMDPIYVEDTLRKGYVIKEYEAVGFTEIDFGDTGDYIQIKASNGKLWIEVTQDFQGWEETHRKDKINGECQLKCLDTPLPQVMRVHLTLIDTNNHVAVFGEDSYRYKLPMPFPPGIDISKNFMTIWAYDADYKSVINFNVIGTDLLKVESTRIDDPNVMLPSASYAKPFYNVILKATTLLDTTEPIIFEITAEDPNYPGMNTTKVKVTIERDSELSVPISPFFEHPLYLVQLKEEIHAGDELDTMPGPIRLEDASAAYEIEFVDGDEGLSSHFDWDSTKNALVVTKEFAEPEIPDARFGILTLKATVKNAVRPGYSVVNIAFPEKEVPTTTLETTTLCPTTPEPPTTEWESTEDPCSKCPTPEPHTFPTCPPTDEPPTCPPCPTIPDEPETTSAYVSSTTGVTTTTNGGGHSTTTTLSTLWTDRTSEEASTTECNCPTCYCPTSEEVTCPEPPTCLPCPTFPSTVSEGGDGDGTSFSGSTSGNTTASQTTTSGTSGSTSGNTTASQTTTSGTSGSTIDNTTASPTSTSGTSPATDFTCPETPTCPPCPTFPSTVSEGGDGDGTSFSGSTSGNTTASPTTTSGTSGSTSGNTTTSPTPTSGTSPATDFTCPEITTTVLPDPPENASLKFQCDEYHLWARNGFVGVISRIVADPYPPDLERWGKIEYALYFFDKGQEGPLKISNGDLYCTQELEVKNYYFAAVAKIPGIIEAVPAGVNLTVSPLEICQNGTNIVTIFPKSFMSITVQEEKTYHSLTEPLGLPSGVECGFHLEVTPQELAINFQVSKSSGVVSMLKVDREDKVFKKAVVPEIDVILSAECTISDPPPTANDAFGGEDWAVNYASMVIHIRVMDIEDHPPVFAKENYLIGYPEKSIAEAEHPPTLGATVATDDDVGLYSEIEYSLDGLYEFDGEVILDRESGVLYPHPQRFTYQDFSFIVEAKSYYRTARQNVTVKILSSKYLSEIHAVGKRLDEAQEVMDGLSKSTGLSVGMAGAPLMVANKEMNEQSIRGAAVASEDRESSMIEEDAGGRRLKDPSAQNRIIAERNDGSYYLRLVVHAFNGSEPVIADNFKSKAGNVSSDLRVVEYSSVNTPCDTSGAGAMSAAVTALAVILGLLVAAIVAFVVYRWRKNRSLGDNDSMESGLVQENDFRKEKHPMYDSERSSIVYENKMDAGEQQQQNGAGDSSPERRKSVAFAEEPQVIPSEDDEGDIKM